MKIKKQYTAPIVKKVRLDIKTSVLATCHTSVTIDPLLPPDLGGACTNLLNTCPD